MIDRLIAGGKKNFRFPELLLNISVISWAGVMSTRYRHESRSSSGEKSEHKLVATYCRGCYRMMCAHDGSFKID